MNGDYLLGAIGTMTQQECRELGEMILRMAAMPRDAAWQAMIAEARTRVSSEAEITLASRIAAGNARVKAHSDRLWADGLGHRQLVEAELVRRGDTRTFEQLMAARDDQTSQ